MEITFITSNAGKVREAANYLEPLGVRVVQRHVPYPEIQADTLEEVARYGVEWLSRRIDGNFFIEDSGLFINALSGFPGVYSAYVYRTVGLKGVLKLMEDSDDRRASFRSVIAYWDGEPHVFKGEVRGEITRELRGSGGFGFDPIFKPEGFSKTFAEMSVEEKNRVSHRGAALRLFCRWLKENLK
ncbi:MAG: XTP/dITP diphosphatase [Thermococci archaeon]|nr:XTP/dITP diphosphatase [Thermococci archaeon]